MSKNILLTLIGFALLLSGIILVLREWANLVIVFKGIIGGTMAVIGLFILFLVGGKSSKS